MPKGSICPLKRPEKRDEKHRNDEDYYRQHGAYLYEVHKPVAAGGVNENAGGFERSDERERGSVSYCNDEGSGI